MGFASNAASQSEVRVLIYADWDHYWPQTSKFIQLRMYDIAYLDQWRLYMCKIGLSLASSARERSACRATCSARA